MGDAEGRRTMVHGIPQQQRSPSMPPRISSLPHCRAQDILERGRQAGRIDAEGGGYRELVEGIRRGAGGGGDGGVGLPAEAAAAALSHPSQ